MKLMMSMYFWWLVLGGAALVLALANVVRALRKRRGGWQGMLFASLSCGVLAVLCTYLDVYREIGKGDWSALTDVVPTAARLNGAAVCVGLLLNFFALYIHLRGK